MASGWSYPPGVTEFVTREFPSKWRKINLLYANGMNEDYTNHSMIASWRFSPGGKVAVAVEEHLIEKGYCHGFALYFYDVHNNLWFGQPFSLKSAGIQFENIFTYHMLDENTVVVIETKVYNQVKQHIIKVDMENHTAELTETIIHDFLPRTAETDRPNFIRLIKIETPDQHVPVKLKGQYYTALVGRKRFCKERKIVYLVPRNPQDPSVQPMEFSVAITLSTVNKDQLDQFLDGQKDIYLSTYDEIHFQLCGTSSSPHELRFVPRGISLLMEGVYLTIDLSKLIDIHNKPIEAMEQRTRDIQQADATTLIIHPYAKIGRIKMEFTCGLEGSLVMFYKGGLAGRHNMFYGHSEEWTRELRCHFSKSDRVIETKTSAFSWLALHPCGAVLQFYMNLGRREEFYVRVVYMYRNTLKSLASTKLIFEIPDGNRRIDSIYRLHQMIYNGEQPVKLHEETKKKLKK